MTRCARIVATGLEIDQCTQPDVVEVFCRKGHIARIAKIGAEVAVLDPDRHGRSIDFLDGTNSPNIKLSRQARAWDDVQSVDVAVVVAQKLAIENRGTKRRKLRSETALKVGCWSIGRSRNVVVEYPIVYEAKQTRSDVLNVSASLEVVDSLARYNAPEPCCRDLIISGRSGDLEAAQLTRVTSGNIPEIIFAPTGRNGKTGES